MASIPIGNRDATLCGKKLQHLAYSQILSPAVKQVSTHPFIAWQ
jgi:hypothetical protein